MALRDPIKQALRVLGHAFSLTVHERLDLLDRQVKDLSLQLAAIAETQEALLRAAVYLIEDRQRQAAAARDGGSPAAVSGNNSRCGLPEEGVFAAPDAES
jgi:hypothetical protein